MISIIVRALSPSPPAPLRSPHHLPWSLLLLPTESCPSGDDPLTAPQVNEVQLAKCVAPSGYFVLYYNNQPSDRINARATTQEMKKALEVSRLRLAIGNIIIVIAPPPPASAASCSS
jgi:hypothetical protein